MTPKRCKDVIGEPGCFSWQGVEGNKKRKEEGCGKKIRQDQYLTVSGWVKKRGAMKRKG